MALKVNRSADRSFVASFAKAEVFAKGIARRSYYKITMASCSLQLPFQTVARFVPQPFLTWQNIVSSERRTTEV